MRQPMTADRLRACLTALDWNQRQLARILEKDPRQVRRWASGEYPPPPEIAAWLETLAGVHEANPPPATADRAAGGDDATD